MAEIDIGSPDWWLHRLVERLMIRQLRYNMLYKYATGDHPTPPGDEKYAKFLKKLILMAQTNYVGLAIRAVVERMRVKDFRFGQSDSVDEDARRLWMFNHMELQSTIAINDGATFGESYTMVSPPDPNDSNGLPIITVEDPRQCITEPDPLRPMRSLAGLKFYEDQLIQRTVAKLILKDEIHTWYGPKISDIPEDVDQFLNKLSGGPESAGFEYQGAVPNTAGEVCLIRGVWQPDHGPIGLAECENGALDVQDRINFVVLSRLVISHNQAYRQRWGTGINPVQRVKKGPPAPPFDPGADTLWLVPNDKAKFGDFEQADIRQLLEATRDDVGDFAAITQTPVTYLTNRMVNVSGEALTSAQASLVSKTRLRMKAMSWYFEQIIRLAFKYQNNAKADEVFVETLWADPEIRSLAEIADMVGKFAAAGIPMQLLLERANFSSTEIEFAIKEIERVKAEQMEEQQQMLDMQTDSAVTVQKEAAKNQPANQDNPAGKPKPKATSKGKA